jgi:hypothetical protein
VLHCGKQEKSNYNPSFTKVSATFKAAAAKKEPAVVNEEPAAGFSFDKVIMNWSGFVNEISTEKALTLGVSIKTVTPLKLESGVLNLETFDDHSLKELNFNSKYLHDKFHEYFGKKLKLNFIQSFIPAAQPSSSEEIPANDLTNKVFQQKKENDKIAQAVIDELGGEEIL